MLELIEDDRFGTPTHVKEWPGTRLIGSNTATLHTFRLSLDVQRMLRTRARSILDWSNPELPDDLHFLREDGTLIFGSIAHENYAWVVLNGTELALWKAANGPRLVRPRDRRLGHA